MKSAVLKANATQRLMRRFDGGVSHEQAVAVAGELAEEGLLVSLNHITPGVRSADDVDRVIHETRVLAELVAAAGLARTAEISVKLSELGQLILPHPDPQFIMDSTEKVCGVSAEYGVQLTLDVEEHDCIPMLFNTATELRTRHPELGVAIPANWPDSVSRVDDLAKDAARVRLVKGCYQPSGVTQRRHDVDRQYVKLLGRAFGSGAYPMVASHDPRIIKIADSMASRMGYSKRDFEYQMLHGIRNDEQRRLVSRGFNVRVYVPYGANTFPWFMNRLRERPANVLLLARDMAAHHS